VTVLDRSRRSDALWHALAKLDDDPSAPPTRTRLSDEAPWFTVTGDLPQYLRRASRAEPSSRSLTGLSDRLLVVQ